MISIDVPPKNIAKASFTPASLASAGMIATNARNNDPGNVILETSESCNPQFLHPDELQE